MSLFLVSPAALEGETVAEWLDRTETERKKNGWSIAPSMEQRPRGKFLISEWIDPDQSPLPRDKEHIWDKHDWMCVDGAVTGEHKSVHALVPVRPLQNIHEIAVIVDVRGSLLTLERNFRTAVLSHRAKLSEELRSRRPDVYSGKPIINNRGIYDEYVKILQRLHDGETEADIRFSEYRGAPRMSIEDNYYERVKKQIPKAIELRDGGYKDIAYRDDFVGELKHR